MRLNELEILRRAYNIMLHDDRFEMFVCRIILDVIIEKCRTRGVEYFFKENGDIILN
jgi:hypothetical protein